MRQRFIPGLEAGLIDRDAQGRPTRGAGELLVQPWVRERDGPWRRLDDVLGPGFLVAASSADVLVDVDDTLRAEWAALGGPWLALDSTGEGDLARGPADGVPGKIACAALAPDALPLEERDGLLAGWLRERGAVALVARPDRYVYGIARSGEELGRLVLALGGAM